MKSSSLASKNYNSNQILNNNNNSKQTYGLTSFNEPKNSSNIQNHILKVKNTNTNGYSSTPKQLLHRKNSIDIEYNTNINNKYPFLMAIDNQCIMNNFYELNEVLEFNITNQLNIVIILIHFIKYLDPSGSYPSSDINPQLSKIKPKIKKNSCLGILKSNSPTNIELPRHITNENMNSYIDKEKTSLSHLHSELISIRNALHDKLNMRMSNNGLKNTIQNTIETKGDTLNYKSKDVNIQISTTKNSMLGTKRSSLPILKTTETHEMNIKNEKMDNERHKGSPNNFDDYQQEDIKKMRKSHELVLFNENFPSSGKKSDKFTKTHKLNIGAIQTTASTNRHEGSGQTSYRGEFSSRIYKSPQKPELLDPKEIQIQLELQDEDQVSKTERNSGTNTNFDYIDDKNVNRCVNKIDNSNKSTNFNAKNEEKVSDKKIKQDQDIGLIISEKQRIPHIDNKQNPFNSNIELKGTSNMGNNNDELNIGNKKNNVILGNILREKQHQQQKQRQVDTKEDHHKSNKADRVSKTEEINLNQEQASIELLALKPYLDTMAKKDLIEENIKDNDEDITENMNHESSRGSNTQRGFKTTEIDENKIHMDESYKLQAYKEKLIIKTLLEEEKEAKFNKSELNHNNEKKYIICAKWWRSWKEYVNFDGPDLPKNDKYLEFSFYPKPGRISNRELIKQEAIEDLGNMSSEIQLKSNLLENHDYVILNKKIFLNLKKWYNCDYEIIRFLKPDPFYPGKFYLDLYPTYINHTNPINTKISNQKKVIDKAKVAEILYVNLGNIRNPNE